jgi:hypothetical protein
VLFVMLSLTARFPVLVIVFRCASVELCVVAEVKGLSCFKCNYYLITQLHHIARPDIPLIYLQFGFFKVYTADISVPKDTSLLGHDTIIG